MHTPYMKRRDKDNYSKYELGVDEMCRLAHCSIHVQDKVIKKTS